MPTSVRLDPETELLLRQLARRNGRSKSEIIRDALRRLAQEGAGTPTDEQGTYALIADLIGVARIGPAIARKHKREYREALTRKHRR